MSAFQKAVDALSSLPVAGRAPWEIRAVRVLVALALVAAAIATLNEVIGRDQPILEANKLEVGMLIGWIVAKSGTVIDWLFGGSESGTRRADHAAATSVLEPEPAPQSAKEAADKVAGAAVDEAAAIEGQA